MLFGENARGERVGGIVVEHGYGLLQNDGAAVEIFIDEMHGTAGLFNAMGPGLLLGVETGKRGQQRRVNIEDSSGKMRNEVSAKQTHVAGEANEIEPLLVEQSGDLPVVGIAIETFGVERAAGQAEPAGPIQARGLRAI